MERAPPENKWLPSSPHREEVLKVVGAGRAHIEERGHNIPPLLVFEDGGAIELPDVRYSMTQRGMQLVAGGHESTRDQTRHTDVCGTIDELKALLNDGPETPAWDPELADRLLDHARYMISRMQRRRECYERFAADIASLCKRMAETGRPDAQRAYRKVEEIRAVLRNVPKPEGPEAEELYQLAEGVRSVANRLESCLAAHKEAAIEIGELHKEIKGGRSWKKKDANAP